MYICYQPINWTIMKKLALTLASITLIMSSCTSTYFYSTLETTNYDVEKVENGDFLYENDSLWIAHCFKGEDAPIQITVFNKLNVPLYVDWNKSALILNDVAHSYITGDTQIISTTESTTYNYHWGVSDTRSTTQGTMITPKNVSMIPPKTMVTQSTLRLAAQFDEIAKNKYTKGKLGTKDGMVVNIDRIKFEKNDTPVRFGSYVSVYTKPEDLRGYRMDFYVTHLIKTKATPNNLPNDMADRGDTFYQQKRPNNTGWEILGVTAIVAGTVAIDVLVNKDDCNNCY